MPIQYMTEDLREMNERLGQAFQAAGEMSADELTACRRAVVHGLAIPFRMAAAHEQLMDDLRACLEQARRRGLGSVVGWCMAAAQSPELLMEDDRIGIDSVVVDFIRQTAPPPATVLDVASGRGRFGLLLAGEGYQVSLLDPAAAFLAAAARRAGPGMAGNIDSLLCGTFEDLSIVEGGSYDAVLCLRSVFYACPRESAERAIVHSGRIARKAVVVDVMSKEGLIRRLDDEGFDASPEAIRQIRQTGVTPPAKPEDGGVVYSCFSRPELEAVLARAGLVVHQLLGDTFGDDVADVEHAEAEAPLHLLALCRPRDLTEPAEG